MPEDAHVMFLSFAAVLFGAAGLVLVIACVNVASMLSARAMARRREMAVRAALGAGRARLVRQLLTESIMLSGAGAVAGVGVAWIASSLLESLPLPVDQSFMLELTPDPRVLAFAAVLSVVTGIVFGLAPALRGTSADVVTRLREDSAASAGGKRRAGNALIVAQLALALTLLVTAGLFARSLVAGTSIDPGFEMAHVATLRMNTEAWGYTPEQGRAFYRELRSASGGAPGRGCGVVDDGGAARRAGQLDADRRERIRRKREAHGVDVGHRSGILRGARHSARARARDRGDGRRARRAGRRDQ